MRARQVLESRDVAAERRETGSGHLMAQKLDRVSSKNTLRRVDDKTMGVKELEHVAEVVEVDGHVGAVDEDVVEVHEDEEDSVEQAVHHALEGLCSIL